MRKRHAARPMLESVEDRLVLTSLNALNPATRLQSAITGLLGHHNGAKPAVATHPATAAHANRAAAAAQHHQHTKPVHHPHKTTTTSKSSSSSSSTNPFTNFFKSLGF